MRHFTLPPTVGPRCRPFVILSACPFHDRWLIRNDTPRTLRTSWGTQAIDYSWANLDTIHAAQILSARIQNVDVSLIHASAAERLLIPALDRGILGSIPGNKIFQIKITSRRRTLRLWTPHTGKNLWTKNERKIERKIQSLFSGTGIILFARSGESDTVTNFVHLCYYRIYPPFPFHFLSTRSSTFIWPPSCSLHLCFHPLFGHGSQQAPQVDFRQSQLDSTLHSNISSELTLVNLYLLWANWALSVHILKSQLATELTIPNDYRVDFWESVFTVTASSLVGAEERQEEIFKNQCANRFSPQNDDRAELWKSLLAMSAWSLIDAENCPIKLLYNRVATKFTIQNDYRADSWEFLHASIPSQKSARCSIYCEQLLYNWLLRIQTCYRAFN